MKGYVYTLEVALAIMLMIVTFLSLFANPQKPELETSIRKQAGFNALDFLNKEGVLRELVKNNTEAELESRLSVLVSKPVKLEAEVCKTLCDTTGVPANETVIAVDYYVSAQDENFIGKRVRLWLWKK